MENSILTSIKKLLGVTEDYEVFDEDIKIAINTALATLEQLGVGIDGFHIEDKEAKWSDFLPDENRFHDVKTYVHLKAKIIFDPPMSSAVMEAYKEMAREIEWRVTVKAETAGQES